MIRNETLHPIKIRPMNFRHHFTMIEINEVCNNCANNLADTNVWRKKKGKK